MKIHHVVQANKKLTVYNFHSSGQVAFFFFFFLKEYNELLFFYFNFDSEMQMELADKTYRAGGPG